MEKCYNSRAKSKIINYMYTLWLHIKCEFKDWGNLKAIKPFYSFVQMNIYSNIYIFYILGTVYVPGLMLFVIWDFF